MAAGPSEPTDCLPLPLAKIPRRADNPNWETFTMTITTQAVYAGGVLRPVRPLALAEGETVEVTIAQAAVPANEDETIRRIQACKTYQEWLDVTKTLPTDDG